MSVLIGTSNGAFTVTGDPLIEDAAINHLARDDTTWWAVDDRERVYRDGEVVARGPDGLTLNCVLPSHDSIFVGASEAKLFRLVGGNLDEDEFFQDAPGRESWFTPWGGPADVRSMAVDLDGSVYINIHVGGIIRYDNTGLAPTLDIESDVHQVISHPLQQGTVLAATAYGLAESHNGHDFEIRADGLRSRYCRAVAVLDETVLLSASSGPRSTQGRIYRTSPFGQGFELCHNGLPDHFEGNLDSHCLAARNGSFYAGFGDTVWRSDDLGTTWTEVASGLPRITCLA